MRNLADLVKSILNAFQKLTSLLYYEDPQIVLLKLYLKRFMLILHREVESSLQD